ncbi:MAG: metallophosphoesterase [Deltaproteobacteria bacterium]|nr:metallophosphoesterase [Deltaproteobacteria bacterium]
MIVLFCLLVIAPVLIVRLTHSGMTTFALPLAWIAYMWMGFVFILFFLCITFDCYHSVVNAAGRLGGFDTSGIVFGSSLHSVIVIAFLSVLITFYGFFAARQINVASVTIPTQKLNSASQLFRIVQISDVHLGLLTRGAWVDRLVQTIKGLNPDLVVSTGDLVDVQLDHIGRFPDMLKSIKPRFGKYAVRGNHEVYAGLHREASFFERAGFRMLSNEGEQLGNSISIAGIDDPAVSQRLNTDLPDEKSILERFSREDFMLFLKHQPVVEASSIPFFDLQLSGHSHGGQIFPFNFITRISYRVELGLSKIGQDAWFYHSRGTGTWGPPIRVLAPPEVTVIDLKHPASSQNK